MTPATSTRADARHRSPYSSREKIARLAWAVVQATLFRCSFSTWYGWRAFLLGRFGADVDPTVHVSRTARIECPWHLTMGRNSCLGDHAIAYCLGAVTLGDRVTVSQHAHLCAGTHDHTVPGLPLVRPPITIGDDAWIAADAFVGPAVTVGAGAILGARGCAFGDLEPWTVYGGNPARPLKPRAYAPRDGCAGSGAEAGAPGADA